MAVVSSQWRVKLDISGHRRVVSAELGAGRAIREECAGAAQGGKWSEIGGRLVELPRGRSGEWAWVCCWLALALDAVVR